MASHKLKIKSAGSHPGDLVAFYHGLAGGNMKKLSFAGPACLLSMLACVQLVVPLPLLAQVSSPVSPPVHTHSMPSPGHLNLNLSSTQQTATPAHLLHNTATVNINVGDSSMAV